MGRERPISYLDFVDGLGVVLSPAQRLFAHTAFDRQAPPDNDLAVRLWGRQRPDEMKLLPEASKVAAAVCGRGSGKSLLGGTRTLHLAMTVDVSRLQPREVAVCPVIAPDLDTAKVVVRFALGAAESLGLRIVNRVADGEEDFSIVRANGKRVRIVARAASAGGVAARGRFMPCAVMDEAAFFRDSNHKINDQDIFDALKPRIAPDGQLVLLSSPWMENGLLYDLWRRNFGHPFDAVVAHAPTGLMRTDDPSILRDIELERAVDPEKCARERDAEFMTANAAAFFNPRAIAAMICPDVERVPLSTKAVGGDFAFRRNSTAFVACETHEITLGAKPDGTGGVVKRVFDIPDMLEEMPRGKPLKPSEICAKGAAFARDSGCDEIVADGHYRETVVEELGKGGVTHIIAPEGAAGKAEVAQVVRNLMHEGAIRLKADHPLTDKLLRQLREISARPLSGGGISLDSPTWRTGEHGDLASAFLLAVWRAYRLGWTAPEKDSAIVTDEFERQLMAEEQAKEKRLRRLSRLTGISLLDRFR